MASLLVTATETIHAPWESVWDVFSDTSRYPEWVEGTLAVTRTDGPARLGSTYDEINTAGPIRFTSRWKVIEYELPRRQVHRDVTLPFTRFFDVVFEIAPAGATQTTIVLTLVGESRRGPSVCWCSGCSGRRWSARTAGTQPGCGHSSSRTQPVPRGGEAG